MRQVSLRAAQSGNPFVGKASVAGNATEGGRGARRGREICPRQPGGVVKSAAEPKKAASAAKSKAEDTTDDGQDTAEEQTAQASENGGGSATLRSELTDAIRDAAIEVLKPVAQKATKCAAKAIVTKGPDLVTDKLGPMVSEAGGVGELAKDTLSKGGGRSAGERRWRPDKLTGGGDDDEDEDGKGGKKPTGHGRGRRLPVQEFVDVAVSIDVAYDQYTQFEEFPNFMHRVEKVEQKDDSTLMWHENIWGVRRSWEAEIVEQTPNERIVWRSTGGPQIVGVVTFHEPQRPAHARRT